MSLEQQVADLTTATTQLLDAVNVRRAALDTAVGDAQSYAAEATANGQAQVALAADQVALAAQHAVAADASADAANLSAGEAAGSAAQALALFGDAQAVQTALINAQASASLAEGHALSAGSVVQQDLSAVSAALHRSPNAVTAMFVYDTSKDSDGGAWTEKCQHTSWYNEPINGKWLGAQASEAAARAVSGAATGDYFQLTTDGKFYKLNATSGITEVFRGNKRDFPRLAGIVAEAASVTIYDLTEPGRPMWMRFIQTASPDVEKDVFRNGRAVSSLAAAQGVVAWGLNVSSSIGLVLAKFPADDYGRIANAVHAGRSGKRLSARNASIDAPNLNTVAIVNQVVNAVAMTVLPDAPVDPVTGLKVPTVAVATEGGVSVIQHSGVVRNSSSTSSFNSIAITPQLLSATRTADATFYWAQKPGLLGASFALSTRTSAQAPDFNTGNTNGLIGLTRSELMRRSATAATVQKLKNFESNPVKSLAVTISKLYNTGHQPGDIRRTFLSDIDAGSAGPSTELVTNGTLDTDTTGWSLIFSGSISHTGSALRLTNTNYAGAEQAISTVPGKAYKITGSVVGVSGSNSNRIYVATAAGRVGTALFDSGISSTTRDISGQFIAQGLTTYVTLNTFSASAGAYADFDNISVQEAVADRSYMAKPASITGTLTKSAVASNAQLVAYSGFSAENYLREPYSSDLDFGAGEWSVGAWVNVPTTLPVSSFPAVGSNLFVGFPIGIGTWVDNGGGSWSIDGTQTTGQDLNGDNSITVPNGTTLKWTFTISGANGSVGVYSNNSGPLSFGNGTHTYIVERNSSLVRFRVAAGIVATVSNISVIEVGPALLADRAHSSGAKLDIGVNGLGRFTATAYDGTTTRTVTTSAAYNTGTWLNARADYTTDGKLSIKVNGAEVASATGAPLLTLNNSNAVLTIGNSYALDAPFPGSIALLKLSATVPTAEQSVWMYEQEKHLFREGAQCCLPDSGSIVDLSYDDATDTWVAASATNISEWSGLVRTKVTPVPAGSYSKLAASSGVKLAARTTSSPGVDVEIPAYGLREELVKRAEAAAQRSKEVVTFDFDVTAGQTEFALPVGYVTKAVYVDGAAKRQGSTKDYTLLFDGFKETVKFAVAPAAAAWVQIHAIKE